MAWQDYRKMEMLRAVFLKRGVTRIQSMGYWLNPSDKGYESNLLLNWVNHGPTLTLDFCH